MSLVNPGLALSGAPSHSAPQPWMEEAVSCRHVRGGSTGAG